MSSTADAPGTSRAEDGPVLTTTTKSLPHLQRFYEEYPLSDVGPDQKTVDMIKYYLKAREEHGFKLIESIRSNKDFGNPYILSKVVEHYNINQFGTNFPKEIFDPQEVTAEGFEESIKRRRVGSSAVPVAPGPVPSSAPGPLAMSGMPGAPQQPPMAGYAGATGAAAALAAAVASINSSISGPNASGGVAPAVREDSSKRKSKWG